jgi:hypothetical protein
MPGTGLRLTVFPGFPEIYAANYLGDGEVLAYFEDAGGWAAAIRGMLQRCELVNPLRVTLSG